MKKLQRFLVLTILFILLWIFGYSIIPTICFFFGGSFSELAKNPIYIFFCGVVCLPTALGLLFYDCFDKNFYSKK